MSLFNRIGPGNAFKMLSSFMNPDLAYEKAGKKAEQYYNQSQQQMQPYIQQGQNAYGGLDSAMQNLLNPVQLESQWASSYETSPYAKMAQQMAQNQGLDAASSMAKTFMTVDVISATVSVTGVSAATVSAVSVSVSGM